MHTDFYRAYSPLIIVALLVLGLVILAPHILPPPAGRRAAIILPVSYSIGALLGLIACRAVITRNKALGGATLFIAGLLLAGWLYRSVA